MFLLHFLRLFGIPLLFVLLPLAFYTLILASINRRPHPVVVSGALDAVGTLFAGSGFFLVLVPTLIDELYYRALGAMPGQGPRGLFAVWAQFWVAWLAYYVALIAGGALLIAWRAGKTMIYNVDADRFAGYFSQALTRLGLGVTAGGQRLVVHAEPPGPADAIKEAPSRPPLSVLTPTEASAEVEIDPFPLGHHVTLHWDRHGPLVRRAVERELRQLFAATPAPDNPAGGWLLVLSGFLFGLITLVAFLYVTTPLLYRRF